MAQFFQRRGRGFQMRTRGASSSTSDSMERVLNRSAAVVSVNPRCRFYFCRFETTLDLRLFQQYRPEADIDRPPIRIVPLDARWTFLRVRGRIEVHFKTPFLFNGHPWSRTETRVRTSQVVAKPTRKPRKAFRLSGRPRLFRRRQWRRQTIGRDGNEGWLWECWPLWCWRPSGNLASLGSS